ncbi:hypothetical protein ACP70R_019335 [Stipagrostis hirtigluma subsp. patula]
MAALRCHCYSPISSAIVPWKNSSRTPIRASMDSCSSSESKRASSSVSFTSKVNQVYEDKNMGILCYTDENGELVCEGFDEGPRLTLQDIEKLNKEKKMKAEEELRRMTLLVAGGIDFRSLQAAVSVTRN